MPSSARRPHEGTTRLQPFWITLTTHTRHEVIGPHRSRKHSVGISMPSFRAAVRIVSPGWTSTAWPSMVSRGISGQLDGVVGADPPARVALRATVLNDLVPLVRSHRDRVHRTMLRANRAAGALV